jgi:cell division protein FtsI (penicillin-binding protein 3)
LAKVREALEGVVENGTARNLRNASFRVAGKTGTAQIARGSTGYRNEKGVSHQASFVGYFPADKPKFSCIVVVNSPSRSIYYGNLVAGPIFKEIADKVYATNPDWFPMVNSKADLLELPESKSGFKPELERVFSDLGIPYTDTAPTKIWTNTKRSENEVELENRTMIANLVPDVIGMGLKDAIYLLENNGLKVLVKGRGTVRSQSIIPGARAKKGDRITLEMSMS